MSAAGWVTFVWSDGSVSVTTEEVWQKFLALYGKPRATVRPATEEEARWQQRADSEAQAAGER